MLEVLEVNLKTPVGPAEPTDLLSACRVSSPFNTPNTSGACLPGLLLTPTHSRTRPDTNTTRLVDDDDDVYYAIDTALTLFYSDLIRLVSLYFKITIQL